jgi:hypothetical protein
MLRFWRKPGGAAAENVVPSTRVDQLSAHLLRDLNLPEEAGFLSPDSIRNRKLPPAPLF